LKDLEARFTEIEKRVGVFVRENEAMKARVRELEKELAEARRISNELENSHGKQMRIREKVERVLQSLEAMGTKE